MKPACPSLINRGNIEGTNSLWLNQGFLYEKSLGMCMRLWQSSIVLRWPHAVDRMIKSKYYLTNCICMVGSGPANKPCFFLSPAGGVHAVGESAEEDSGWPGEEREAAGCQWTRGKGHSQPQLGLCANELEVTATVSHIWDCVPMNFR